MEALKMIPYIFLILGISGVIAGATVLTLGTFGETMTRCKYENATYNITDKLCWNGTGSTASTGIELAGNLTDEFRTTSSAQEGLGDIAEQFPTIGIIAVMVIIISLISSVFVYIKFFK